jgi:hypothetical protein
VDALAGFACDGDIDVVVTVSRIVGEPALHVPSGSGTAVEEGRADDVARSVRAFTGSGLSYQANKRRPQVYFGTPFARARTPSTRWNGLGLVLTFFSVLASCAAFDVAQKTARLLFWFGRAGFSRRAAGMGRRRKSPG